MSIKLVKVIRYTDKYTYNLTLSVGGYKLYSLLILLHCDGSVQSFFIKSDFSAINIYEDEPLKLLKWIDCEHYGSVSIVTGWCVYKETHEDEYNNYCLHPNKFNREWDEESKCYKYHLFYEVIYKTPKIL